MYQDYKGKVLNNIFKLNDILLKERCPKCDNQLQIDTFYFYGWRSLYDCSCEGCKDSFLMDMPIFSGIPYPAIYDKKKKKIINSIPSWWGNPLGLIENNICDTKIISDIKIHQVNNKVILFNLLDIVYGHSFMRLEKLTYYLDNADYETYDLFVLIPKQLRYLIEKYEDSISLIEISLAFPQYKYFYTEIDHVIKYNIKHYDEIYCEMLKYPQQEMIKLDKLNLPIQKWVNEIKKVVIVYRKDRTVGINRRNQYYFYKKLICRLSTLNIEIIMIGDKDKYDFKYITDMRVKQFDKDTDLKWNNACSGAISLGVHGSNLLIPSLCSAYNIEFVNYDKLYNFGQATAFLETLNQQETIQKYRYIYGNQYLTDINPDLVYEVIKSLVIQMNYVFEAVHTEKNANLVKIRSKYEQLNSVGQKRTLSTKIFHKLIQIRKKINI